MRNKMKWIGHLTVSVIVALILFFYATINDYKKTVEPNQISTTENYTHTINYVPVEMDYDKENYFISGFTSTVTVELAGNNRLQLQQETEESTRTFKIRANLKNLGPGTHTVKLDAVDLASGVTANIKPSTVTVQIGKKASKNFAVNPHIADTQIAKGYRLVKTTLGTLQVSVTTDESTMTRVDHVEAVIPDQTQMKEDFKGVAKLQAVDSEGNVLPVTLSSNEAQIEVTIKKN